MAIKAGGCSEDCSYCAQSSRYQTELKPSAFADKKDILTAASYAKSKGASRFCMGAAWKELKDKQLDKISDIVRAVADLDIEVCCSLGMVSVDQARKLKQAGLTYYNHNIDTSEEYYSEIITTHTYKDRLRTIANVTEAGIAVCSGGIIGMGEAETDRIKMIHTLASLPVQPDSIPINVFVPVKGTPLAECEAAELSVWDLVRTIACMRIIFPASKLRLSAGRNNLSATEQALCFVAGINSIFIGEKLLTTKNIESEKDQELFKILGIKLVSDKKS
jgi:biotin synthase